MAALEQELASTGNGVSSHQHTSDTSTQVDEYPFDKYDYSSFVVERPSKARILKLCFLYVLSTTLLIASMASNVNYLVFKFRLYIKEIHSVARAPWLFLILLCEVLYCISNFIAAIDYTLPPNLQRPGLFLPKYHDEDEEEDDAPAAATNGHVDGAANGHPNGSANGHANGHPNGHANGAVKRTFAYPKVDIFLPCCKEPTEIPQESILAALAMDYPRHKFRVVVLDDGGDDDLKAFCEAYEMERGGKEKRLVYLRRKKIPGVPHHFKCGNLNFGLEHSNADFVVMMDADMILHPTLFRRLLPHLLCSPRASFVQIPQSFYNLPRGDPLNDACGFGYDRVMIHRDIMGCANCVGTGAIFRRKHIDEIGGFQPQSITEDTMTAFILFNRGYESIYLNEKLQIGLVPWTFEAYIKQRQRWGQGAIQQFSATWRSMLGRGSKLNFFKKACYIWHTGYYYMSAVNIVLALTLLCSLAFNLRLTVGDENENRTLVLYLSLFLVMWRILWYSLWLEVPQAIQSRNRDESQFWWMTPFFFEMVVKAAWDMKSTFKFVPTSNIDRRVNNKKKGADGETKPVSCVSAGCNDIKVLRVHIIFVVLSLVVVLVRIYISLGRHEARSCRETFVLIGLSFFVIPVCFHMMVPVFHILWGTGYKPEQRRSLLKHSSDGVPQFDPSVDCVPKFHWSIVFFELMSYATLAFWAVVLYYTHSRSAYHHVDRFCYGRL